MSTPFVLVVDDEPDIRSLLCEILDDEGFTVDSASNASEAQQALRSHKPDLILLDIWMPDLDGISLLKEWSENSGLPCPVIMMSGHGRIEHALEATRLGAYDFIEKPLSIAKLLLTVEHALEHAKLHRENSDLKQLLVPLDEPIGRSEPMQKLRSQIKRIAHHDTWVLLSGEAGTGKMSFARYLHSLSLRKDSPFIEVSAGNLTKENSSEELFGKEDEDRVIYGLLEQANNGTMFINEVTDLDMQTQIRLLSALQSGKITRVGATEPTEIDVRIVAATRLNIAEEVKEGRFRDDLYYQLNVVPIHIPSLREHQDDVHELLEYYIDLFVRRDGLKYRKVSIGAQNKLRNYPWPGNIRELKNMVQRLLILGTNEEISLEEIEKLLGDEPVELQNNSGYSSALFELPLKEARDLFEKEYLQHQIDNYPGGVSQMAKRIGVERTNLYRKLKSYGLDPKDK
ncbi:MAG: sigma-54-dependent Fis family transcriptional regulator [Gammaproteobacteria bacterium]|nr:MAG: sigma-54-dependent Fis family transcriptional regulator [Gammaproteobacteria bacterium]